MARRVTMNLTCNATFAIRLDDGSKVGFNGGPLDWTPDQWYELRGELQRMTPAEACAHLDAAGWTRFGVDQEPCTDQPVPRTRVEAALRYLTERLSGQAVDQETRDGVAAIIEGRTD